MRVVRSQPDPFAYRSPEICVGVGGPTASGTFHPDWRSTASLTSYAPELVEGERTVVIIAWGQSIIGNYASDSYSRSSSKNQQMSLVSGGVYAAANPNQGSTAINGSANQASYMTRIGDVLIGSGYCDRCIGMNVAVGGSYIEDWATGGVLNGRLPAACARLASRGLIPASLYKFFVLMHQGEAHDCLSRGLTSAQYATKANSALATIRGFAWQGSQPFATAKAIIQTASYNNSQDSGVRAGQALIPDGALTFAGFDIDTIGEDGRYDHAHLNSAGSAAAASGTAAAISSH